MSKYLLITMRHVALGEYSSSLTRVWLVMPSLWVWLFCSLYNCWNGPGNHLWEIWGGHCFPWSHAAINYILPYLGWISVVPGLVGVNNWLCPYWIVLGQIWCMFHSNYMSQHNHICDYYHWSLFVHLIIYVLRQFWDQWEWRPQWRCQPD